MVGGTINVREFEGEIQSVAIQKTYLNPFEPIWKKRSPNPATRYSWLGINEESFIMMLQLILRGGVITRNMGFWHMMTWMKS